MCEGGILRNGEKESRGDGAGGWWIASGDIRVQSAAPVEVEEIPLTG